MPLIAGVQVNGDQVWQLVEMLGEPAATTLHDGYRAGTPEIVLTVEEKAQLLQVLDYGWPGLEELRRVLVDERRWYKRRGLP